MAQMEADSKGSETLQKAHAEAQSLLVARQELMSKLQQLTHHLQKKHGDVQEVPSLRSELDSLRQEYQHCRATYDYVRKLRIDHYGLLQVMEKNCVSMADHTVPAVATVRMIYPGGVLPDKMPTKMFMEFHRDADHPGVVQLLHMGEVQLELELPLFVLDVMLHVPRVSLLMILQGILATMLPKSLQQVIITRKVPQLAMRLPEEVLDMLLLIMVQGELRKVPPIAAAYGSTQTSSPYG